MACAQRKFLLDIFDASSNVFRKNFHWIQATTFSYIYCMCERIVIVAQQQQIIHPLF